MSNRALTDWISGFMQLTENTEPPMTFRLWTAISVIASALQRKCYVSMGPKEAGALVFYPNMYILLVGPSASRKGTAMGPGKRLITDIGITLASEATTLQQLIRKLKSVNASSCDPLTGMTEFHASLTIFSKEFTVFLGYHNKELMAHLCDWYDCEDEWRYETVTRGIEKIIGVWLNIFGGTTPSLIQSSMPLDAIGGGLTSRIIMVYEENKDKFVPFPIVTKEEQELYTHLKNDLEKIYLLRGEFKFTKGFIEKFTEWRVEQEASPPNFHDARFEGYIGRRPNHIMKLCMIMSASERGDMVLNEKDLERSISTLAQVEVKMPRVFSGVGRSDIAPFIPMVATYIGQRKKVTISQIMNVFSGEFDAWTLSSRILRTLETMGQVRITNGKVVEWIEED